MPAGVRSEMVEREIGIGHRNGAAASLPERMRERVFRADNVRNCAVPMLRHCLGGVRQRRSSALLVAGAMLLYLLPAGAAVAQLGSACPADSLRASAPARPRTSVRSSDCITPEVAVGENSHQPLDIRTSGDELVIHGELPLSFIPPLLAAAASWMFLTSRRRRLLRQRLVLETLRGERTRLTLELHDTVAQGLTSVGLYIEGARSLLAADAGEAEVLLKTAKSLVRATLADSKRVLNGFGPAWLDTSSLPDALQRMVATCDCTGRVCGTFRLEGVAVELERLVEAHLFRIAQEAITNAIRHAGARSLVLTLQYAAAQVTLTVADDGSRSGTHDIRELETHGNGMRGMRERAREIGASFRIESACGGGMQVKVSIGLHASRMNERETRSPLDRACGLARRVAAAGRSSSA
jgi:signal transduction histidine kinase